jgi:ATP synthase protein I
MKESIGRLAFLVGLLISVAAGFVQGLESTVLPILAVLGVIVGFLNVTGKESQRFLIGTVALMLVGTAIISIPAIGPFVTSIISAFTTFVAGAALIVALKEVYSVTKTM